MCWAVKKIFVQTEMTYGKSNVIVVDIEILIFFLRRKRGEFRGAIIGMIGPVVYIYIYIGPGAWSEDT